MWLGVKLIWIHKHEKEELKLSVSKLQNLYTYKVLCIYGMYVQHINIYAIVGVVIRKVMFLFFQFEIFW